MRRSGIGWATQVVTPWCLSFCLLLAITPEAGQTATIGGSFSPLTARAPDAPNDLVPLDSLALTGDFGAFSGGGPRLLRQASLETGAAGDFTTSSDEEEPRASLKSGPPAHPAIDRTNKGDPAIGLRPTFDSKLRQPGGLQAARANQLIAPHDDNLPTAGFSLSDSSNPLDGATGFSPWSEGDEPEGPAAGGEPQGNNLIAMKPAALKERLLQGATPKVSRAEALASATPAPADGAPVMASFGAPAAPQIANGPDVTSIPRNNGQPNYAALLEGEHGARERKCLAEAVYFEARSEPEEGQAAVAQVVLNRAASGLYPASICGVVYQNRTHYKACQFSFACEGRSLRVNEPEAWHTAERIADDVVHGKTYLSDVGGATHYHANYVRPGWARRLVKMDVIGHHIFYKLKPGQT
ncbi:MAG: cell wall hydrolase [Beijerinckiaceae bacterium]|nr:cell wall hydrolase [Beijerinckiaceae bacterium]